MPLEYADEAQRLADHYSRMYDEELLNLAADSADLTEIAQQVLRNELKKRELSENPGPQTSQKKSEDARFFPPSQWETAPYLAADQAEDQAGENSLQFSWKTLLCDCETREQAWQIYEVLRRSKIESWIEAPSSSAMELSGPRVVVAADQLERAREIAAQPIPQDVVDESMIKIPEFELPVCPRCGAADPVLEGADPVNSWSCEACGNQWSDPAESLSEKPGQ